MSTSPKFIASLLLWSSSGLAANAAQTPDCRPNLVFLLADDLAAGAVGYPEIFSRTEPWDRMAGLLGQCKVASGAGNDEPARQPRKKRNPAKEIQP